MNAENIGRETREQADRVRKEAEKSEYILTEAEYETLLQYTIRKSRRNGKDDSYIPILLETEIRDYFFRNAVNAITFLRMMATT